MRIETAVYASQSGLDVHGQGIAVVGDNISNSSTVGFKTARAEFADLLATGEEQTVPETMPNVGCGVTVSRVRSLFDAGIIEDTGRNLDVALDGNGFFMVGTAAAPKLTRAGNFQVSQMGFLETSSGDQVLGFQSTDTTTLGPIDMVHVNTGGTATKAVAMTGNLTSMAETTTAPATPASFSELQAAASFSSSFDVFDSLGASHQIALYFFKTDTNTWSAQAYVDSSATGGTAGKPQQIGKLDNMKFSDTGVLTGTASLTANVTFSGAAPSSVAVDLSKMTQYASASGVTNITRDGQSGGAVQSYQFEGDGRIMATLAGGSTVQVGRVQLANVANVDGLDRAGNTLFMETALSGARTTGNPGETGFGRLRGGALERSTVDISKEFVNLVMLQRGYQANAQVLSQTNDMLKQAIGLLR